MKSVERSNIHASHLVHIQYFFGGGIQATLPGASQAGRPLRVIDMGVTQVPRDLFHTWLQENSRRFTPHTYNLFEHNCNNFADEVCQFLLGKSIPSYITGLPQTVLSTPMGQMFKPMVDQMFSNVHQQMSHGSGSFVPWAEGDLVLPTDEDPLPDADFIHTSETAIPAAQPEINHATAAATMSALLSAAAQQLPHASAPPTLSTATTPTAAPLNPSEHKQAVMLLCVEQKARQYHALFRINAKKVQNPLVDAFNNVDVGVQQLVAIDPGVGDCNETTAKQLLGLLEILTHWPAELLFPAIALYRQTLLLSTFRRIAPAASTNTVWTALQGLYSSLPAAAQLCLLQTAQNACLSAQEHVTLLQSLCGLASAAMELNVEVGFFF